MIFVVVVLKSDFLEKMENHKNRNLFPKNTSCHCHYPFNFILTSSVTKKKLMDADRCFFPGSTEARRGVRILCMSASAVTVTLTHLSSDI